MDKHWKEWGEDCPSCGGPSQVFTLSTAPHTGYDQDEVMCMDCYSPGMLHVDEDEAWVAWDMDNHDDGCGV